MKLSGMAEAGNVFAHADAVVSEPVYFLLHVPKCAGQTVDSHIMAHAPPGSYYLPRKRRGMARRILRAYDAWDMPDPSRLRIVNGHWIGRSLESRFGDREIRRAVLLRDPLSHAISYYNYRMMRYRSNGQGAYEFDVAYRAASRDPVCHFLLYRYLEIPWVRLCVMSTQDKYDLLNRCFNRFWFAADYGRCDDLIVSLAEALGMPNRAVRENTGDDWHKRVDWTPLTADDLTAAQRSRIVEDNILDQLLWESWREAGHDTANIRPKPLPGKACKAFITNEALRPWYQVERRWKRATGAIPATVDTRHSTAKRD